MNTLPRIERTLVSALLCSIAWTANLHAQVSDVFLPTPAFEGQRFGAAVALDADRVLIGSQYLPVGSQHASVYERSPAGSFVLVAQLSPPPGDPVAWFGVSVDLDGDRAVVGATHDSAMAQFAGSAFVFERDAAGAWAQVAKLFAADAEAYDSFGRAVAISGDFVLIGAPEEDELGSLAGAAYVFERQSDGTWPQVQKLLAADGKFQDLFGSDVALSNDKALVGAPWDDEPLGQSGAAYVFERDGSGVWSQTAVLSPGGFVPSAYSGRSVDIDGGRAVLGADYGVGAAFVFEQDPSGAWSETATLKPTDVFNGEEFGWDVALSGERILVGCLHYVWSPGPVFGRAYLFEHALDGSWVEVAQFTSVDSPPDPADGFGNAVALDGRTALVGAPWDVVGGVSSGSAQVTEFPLLSGSPASISLSSGGAQVLEVDGAVWEAGFVSFVLGTTSGTSPGLPAGPFTLPLNPDTYFWATLVHPGAPPLKDGLGILDSLGDATASFVAAPATDPTLAGVTVHHAALGIDVSGIPSIAFASTAVPLSLVP